MNRILLLIAVLAAGIAFYLFGLADYFSLEAIKAQQASLQGYVTDRPVLAVVAFMATYVAMTALSLPSAVLLTLLAGALFGAFWGTVIVSFASTIGSTLAMLTARYLLRDSLQGKYVKQLKNFNEGFAKEGAFYLFALRLVPVLPFFMVNLLMGLLPIRTVTYFWVSQLGMLPGTAVYVYAGTALASLGSLADIASPRLLLAFALLGLLPLITKRGLALLQKGRKP